MSLTDEPDGAPQKVGVSFAYMFAGIYGVINVQATLAERNTSRLGKQD
jgi:crotonobetainyl-CoA:carnitine CoA-transferase CaiB-like acyl-CoA transferase